jgi:hypothetical protein
MSEYSIIKYFTNRSVAAGFCFSSHLPLFSLLLGCRHTYPLLIFFLFLGLVIFLSRTCSFITRKCISHTYIIIFLCTHSMYCQCFKCLGCSTCLDTMVEKDKKKRCVRAQGKAFCTEACATRIKPSKKYKVNRVTVQKSKAKTQQRMKARDIALETCRKLLGTEWGA